MTIADMQLSHMVGEIQQQSTNGSGGSDSSDLKSGVSLDNDLVYKDSDTMGKLSITHIHLYVLHGLCNQISSSAHSSVVR